MKPSIRRLVPGMTLLAVMTATAFLFATSALRAKFNAELTRAFVARSDLQELAARLGQLRDDGRQTGLAGALVWDGGTRADIELSMQSEVVGLAGELHIILRAFGPGSPPAAVKNPAVGYQFEGEGQWGDVFAFLDRLERMVPAVSISELSIRQLPSSESDLGQSRVAFRTGIWGFAPKLGDPQ